MIPAAQCASRWKSRKAKERALPYEKHVIAKQVFLPVGNWQDTSSPFILRMDSLSFTSLGVGGNMLAYKLEDPAGVDSRTTGTPDLPL